MGLLVVQVLRWKGARVACVIGASASRLARAKELGAEAVWNVAEQGTEGLWKALEDELGELPPVAIEAAGHPSAMPTALGCVRPSGRVVLLGLSGNQLSEICMDDIVLKQLMVRGSLSSEPQDWRAVVQMLSSGAVQSIVTHTLRGLDKYVEAIEQVRKPPEGMLKLALLPNAESADADAEAETPHGKRARHA
ncbi:unnamed protein product [Polarella glacialis]|uniref:Alcohol dehydrogenase-like C-terminal domain-containing protein n=1 Tax=Polarella glacialis TaxID=89957 RepID=A0A813K786_POLGL|nr:unnamed protein product [Polarella glacialis]CAE8694430.1 unnamed protein product [Polarella glacialis]